MLFKYILRNMCLAIMAPVSQLICVKEWRKSTKTFELNAPIFLENKISRSLTAVCASYYQSLQHFVFTKAHFSTCMRLYNMALPRICLYAKRHMANRDPSPLTPSPPSRSEITPITPYHPALHAFTHINHGAPGVANQS